MVFSNYRELIRGADAQKWFAVMPEAVEAVKSLRTATNEKGAEGRGQRPANVVELRVKAAA